MRGLTRFAVGELVTIDGSDYRFIALVPPVEPRADGTDDLQFQEVRHHRIHIFTPDELYALYVANSVRLHRMGTVSSDQVIDDEPPGKALLRRWRHFWTTTWDAHPVPKSTAKLASFIEKHRAEQPDPIDAPSPHTVRTWLRTRGQQEDRRPRSMGNRARARGRRRPIRDELQAIWDSVSLLHWKNRQFGFDDLVAEVTARVNQFNLERTSAGPSSDLKAIGRTTMWRWLKKDRTYANVCSREGRHVADREFKAILGSLEAKRLLDTVVFDHKRMDIHLVDQSRRYVLGRPWLAQLIDVKSRVVLGYFLSFEPPSLLSVMACIRMALRGFPDLKSRYPDVVGAWEGYGIPQTILVDNTWESTGSSFIDACKDQGISIRWAPIYDSQYKGIVERSFRTLDVQLVHKLPGAVTGTPQDLAERRIDPQADACLTLTELNGLVARHYVDVYSLAPHEALNAAPLQVWRDRADKDGVQLAHDLASVDHAMATLEPDRTLSREGVEFHGLHYRSHDVDSLLADLLPLQGAGTRRGTAKVKIKYHAEDLSRIFVWNEARKVYVALPCTQEAYSRGLSMRVHQELRQRQRDAHLDFQSEEDAARRKIDVTRAIQATHDLTPRNQRRPRAKRQDAKDASTMSASGIAVHALSARASGDRPEKAAVRSKKSSKAKQNGSPPPPAPEPSTALIVDPFLNVDWADEVEKSRSRVE